MRISDWSSDVCSSDLSWTISDDGKTFTFKMRPGITFASGNPMTAEDAVFSLQRAVILDKSPAFIITQFGFTADNVEEKIRATDDMTFVLETDKPYAPTLVLYCLTSTIASVVDRSEEHTSELQSLMRISYAYFCLKKKN